MVIPKKLVKRKRIDKEENLKTVSSKKKKLSLKLFKPTSDFEKFPKIIYGERKIGKTTLALCQPGNYSIMFEPNESYVCFKDDVNNWQEFLDLQEEFLEGNHPYRNMTIDGGGEAYEMAMDFGCKLHKIEHPGGMKDFGMSWSRIKKVFKPPMLQLMKSQFGFTIICHDIEKEIETKLGAKYLVVRPNLAGQAYELWVGAIHNIFYYHIDNGERFLQIQGDDYITAGHRMRGHFLTTKKERIFKIPMGNSPEEAYENLIRAYKNSQKETFRPLQISKEKGDINKLRKITKRKA